MAYYKISQNKDGSLKAKIQVSGKNPATGKNKVFVKVIHNEEKLTEAKFRKFVEKQSILFEEEVTTAFKEEVVDFRSRILTFSELVSEWKAMLKANLSQNYLERAEEVEKKFTEYLQEQGLLQSPISEITVRDIQLFLNKFAFGTYIRGKTAKLKKPLLETINFRKLAREKVVNRNASYYMKQGNKIQLTTAQTVCEACSLNFDDYFEICTTEKQYAQETVKGYRRILRTIFNEAVRYGWIDKNPVCGTKIGAGKANVSLRPIHEKEVFTISEVQELMRLINALPYDYINNKIMVEMMLFTGVRNGELHGLRWEDIDFARKVVHVRRNRQLSNSIGYYEKAPKTPSSVRDIPLPDFLIDDLREYYQWFLLVDSEFEQKLDKYYLAVNMYREPENPQGVGNWLRRFEDKHGLKRITCHGLRHTYCSILLSKNVPIQTVSKYMGHSDPTVTLKVYTHFIIDTQQQAVSTLNNLITGTTDDTGE